MPERHPLGRNCSVMLPLALLLMPYALTRYAIDARRDRRGPASRPKSGDLG